MVSSFLKLLD
ncbi:Protein of unknown function [Bacillus wiedmannii]|uniref:Uncharacterized protein n=1 Tax=Bacillus wiedmannii TaxID=1890302 RepID=A0A1C4AFY5_9BACI|nr:Protein of unknown function [Bacillus wiedmannii]SCV23627.1 Protein of unknown function [Bacillus cereus]